MAETSILDTLTKDQINQAFDKAKRGQVKIEHGLNVKLIDKENYEETFKFLRESYVKDEIVSLGLGMKWSSEFEDFWKGVFSKGMSIILIDANSGKVVGTRCITTMKRNRKLDPDTFKSNAEKKMLSLLQYSRENFNFFEYFGVDEAVSFVGLGIAEEYRNRGLASKLMHIALEFLINLRLDSVYIHGAASSNYSKRIYEKNGFDAVWDMQYEDFQINGEVVINDTESDMEDEDQLEYNEQAPLDGSFTEVTVRSSMDTVAIEPAKLKNSSSVASRSISEQAGPSSFSTQSSCSLYPCVSLVVGNT